MPNARGAKRIVMLLCMLLFRAVPASGGEIANGGFELPKEQPEVIYTPIPEARTVPVLLAMGIKIDGDLNDWPTDFFEMKSTDGRVTASFQFLWSDLALYVAVRTPDESLRAADDPEDMWRCDSVQVALDPLNEKSVSGYGPNDYEFGFGLVHGRPCVHAWCLPEGVTETVVDDVSLAIVQQDKVTCYEAAIPWKVIARMKPKPGGAFGLNICVNDRDEKKDRVAVEWTPGLVFSKQPGCYRTLVLTDGPWVRLDASPKEVMSGNCVRLTGTMYSPYPLEGAIDLSPFGKESVSLQRGLTDFRYYLSADGLKKGENRFEFVLRSGGKSYRSRASVALATVDKEALDLIAVQEKRVPGIEARIAAADAQGVAVAYPRSDLTIAQRFCRYCRDDVAHGRYARALEVACEVEQLLDRAEAETRRDVDVPVLKADAPVEIRDGSFWARCATRHGEETRPVFLTGYGHFPPVVDDLPLFPKIGINVIQIEIGPSSTVFEDGVRTDLVKEYICAALDRARDNGVRVCLLISPHYFPEWAFQKWPELKVDKPGFLRNTLDAPQAREIYRRHLEALIPLIKDHPALHSICLSNEPVSEGAQNDPFRLPLWRAYLQRKHKTIETVNALYGTDYASFDQVPHPALSFDERPAPLYDAVRFNQEAFAEWHAWMAGVIHEMAPDLPCHAKVMMLPRDRGTVLWGTDPWDFARLSQINGNDCSFMQSARIMDRDTGAGGGAWACEWLGQNMYYDLQRSMKLAPIFNTENHIIRDREQKHIRPEHIYSAIWQGAVHGQGGSTTWAWQRTYDKTADFEGLILHRAGCTAAMSRCALDLMRLSKEVAALQNLQPAVALLYSHAATIWDRRHVDARARVYEALNFCGVPIGFITDEQVAAGFLRQYKCLIVAEARAASLDAIEGMRKWAADGGHLVAYDSEALTVCQTATNCVQDEYGRPVQPPDFALDLKAKGPKDVQQLRDEILDYLVKIGIGPEIMLHAHALSPFDKVWDGTIPYGVEWRATKQEGRVLINMINYGLSSVEVQLPHSLSNGDKLWGSWTDLIANRRLGSCVRLESETPVLASME